MGIGITKTVLCKSWEQSCTWLRACYLKRGCMSYVMGVALQSWIVGFQGWKNWKEKRESREWFVNEWVPIQLGACLLPAVPCWGARREAVERKPVVTLGWCCIYTFCTQNVLSNLSEILTLGSVENSFCCIAWCCNRAKADLSVMAKQGI